MKNKKSIIRSMLDGALILTAYVFSLSALEATTDLNSPKISGQSELESKLVEERGKLNDRIGKNKIVHARISQDKKESSHCYKTPQGEYWVVLGTDDANISTLRHELHHLTDDDVPYENSDASFGRKLKYLFWEEPRATIYAAKD